MTHVKDRISHDDFEFVGDYDFTGDIVDRLYKAKIPTNIRLDDDILLFLKRG